MLRPSMLKVASPHRFHVFVYVVSLLLGAIGGISVVVALDASARPHIAKPVMAATPACVNDKPGTPEH